MNRLTKQQQAVYEYIRECMLTRGYGPTVREIGLHMGIRSPNGVLCHLRALEKKQMIVRSANKSRAIELTEPIQRTQPVMQLLGSVAAGYVQFTSSAKSCALLEAIQDNNYLLSVLDDQLLSHSILTGDHLLVSRHSHITAGQLVIAQTIESGQNVVGVVQADGHRLRVQALTHIHNSSPSLQLVGVIVGVIRLYDQQRRLTQLTT